jgi:hypothetical protein
MGVERSGLMSGGRIVSATLLLVGLLSVGCAEKSKTATGDAAERLRRLAVYYLMHAGRYQGNGPASEQKFKAFIKQNAPPNMNVDELFVSPRDGQPYVIIYNVRPGIPSSDSPVIMYERTGEGGTRQIARSSGAVQVVAEAEFEKLRPPAK